MIVPHIGRILVGSDHKALVPFSALFGAFTFLIADTIGRTIAAPYLDIRYQIEIQQLVKKLNQEFGIAISMILHDINQAITYSDNVIGMKDGVVLVEGNPEEVITEESIRELYGIELGVTRVGGRKFVLAV